MFGSHRPEVIVILLALYEKLLPLVEDLQITAQLRERADKGEAVPLADVAIALGLNPDNYR